VAQDDGVNLPRVEGKAAVAVRGLLAVALVEAAFEQQALAVDLDKIHGAGGGAGRAKEMDSHMEFMICDLRFTRHEIIFRRKSQIEDRKWVNYAGR
jgi:hypothetical protein